MKQRPFKISIYSARIMGEYIFSGILLVALFKSAAKNHI
jgi:hypothetical protein